MAVADTVLHRASVVEPHVRQPGARPGGGNVGHEIVLRPLARLGGDQRRADIAIAQLGADHFSRLVLLDVGDARERRTRRGAGGGVLADLRAIELAPRPAPARGKAGRRDVALAHLPALDLIGSEEVRPAPALERRRQLPR